MSLTVHDTLDNVKRCRSTVETRNLATQPTHCLSWQTGIARQTGKSLGSWQTRNSLFALLSLWTNASFRSRQARHTWLSVESRFSGQAWIALHTGHSRRSRKSTRSKQRGTSAANASNGWQTLKQCYIQCSVVTETLVHSSIHCSLHP